MPFNLTGSSPVFSASGAGKFDRSLTGGTASIAGSPLPTSGPFAIECWISGFSGATVEVWVGQLSAFWIGHNASQQIQLHYGAGGTEVTIASGVAMTGSTRYHCEANYDPATGMKFFVNGALVGSSATTMAAAGATYTNPLEIRTFASGAFTTVGELDELAFWNAVQHTSAFTPRTSAIANNAAGLVALYHFDNDLLDSTSAVGATATAVTLSLSASSGAVGSPVTVTVGTDSPLTGAQSVSVAVTHTLAGTVTSSPVTLNAATATATVTVTPSAAGSDTITGTSTGTPTLTAGTASYTATAVTGNNALTGATANVLFSPYNWDIQASSAKTINAGAYFKTIFGGTACTLNFDMTGLVAPLPQISYRVDRHGAWTTAEVAASLAIAIPADTADYAAKGGHLLEVLVKSMTETQARWSTQATAVKLTGIILDTGKVCAAPPALPLKAIFYGDSITEGVRTVNMTATNDTDRNDAAQCWSLEAGRILGAEVGNVGFGATGFNGSGSGGVPALPSSYNLLYSGVSRSFAASPDFIVLMEGTNDSSTVAANATTVLNGLLAATTAKIIVLRPFNGTARASELQAAIAACTTPSRCTYVDTAGFFTTANSSDALHPYGTDNITHPAPLVANAILPVISTVTAAPTGSGTFTTEAMVSSGTLRASQACSWMWYRTASGTATLGTGTLSADAVLTATGLPAGAGQIVVKFTDGGRYYQEGTVA